jgi:hypothetical protein
MLFRYIELQKEQKIKYKELVTSYVTKGVYTDVGDLTLSDESEDDTDIAENDSSSDDDN